MQLFRHAVVIITETLKRITVATLTISYDGRSSVMQHLIEAMLAAGAKMHPVDSNNNAVTPALHTKIVCSSPEEMKQYFDSL